MIVTWGEDPQLIWGSSVAVAEVGSAGRSLAEVGSAGSARDIEHPDRWSFAKAPAPIFSKKFLDLTSPPTNATPAAISTTRTTNLQPTIAETSLSHVLPDLVDRTTAQPVTMKALREPIWRVRDALVLPSKASNRSSLCLYSMKQPWPHTWQACALSSWPLGTVRDNYEYQAPSLPAFALAGPLWVRYLVCL